MIPVLLRIGPITIYSCGLMVALGFIAGDLVLASEFKRKGYDPEPVSMMVLWLAVTAMVGSRIYDIVDNWQSYIADPKSMVMAGAGFVYYGGFIGAFLTSFALTRYYRIPWFAFGDMCAPALALGHAIGRIGCQLSGDGDWGTVSNLPWAMSSPNAIVGWNANTVLARDSQGHLISGFFPGVRVHPAPIYETILYSIVFLILWSLRKKINIEGRLFYVYLMLAGASRFLVEFVRINERVFLGLTESQVIAAMMMFT